MNKEFVSFSDDKFRGDAETYGVAYALIQQEALAKVAVTGKKLSASEYSKTEGKFRRLVKRVCPEGSVGPVDLHTIRNEVNSGSHYFELDDNQPNVTWTTEKHPTAWVKHPKKSDKEPPASKTEKRAQSKGIMFGFFEW